MCQNIYNMYNNESKSWPEFSWAWNKTFNLVILLISFYGVKTDVDKGSFKFSYNYTY